MEEPPQEKQIQLSDSSSTESDEEERQSLTDSAQSEEEEQLPSPSWPSLDEVEEILGYEFRDKCLLEEALTHASYKFPGKYFSYERLEYVGDSVLNLLFTKEQYFLYPDLAPGLLTRLRSANVDTEKLARVAMKLGLHRYLRHRKPMLEEQIQAFSEAIADYPLHSNGLVRVPKALADIVESTVGAVFIDSGCSVATVWKVFKDLLEPTIVPETLVLHPVSKLYEVCQKNNLKLRFVDLWIESMSYNVFIEDKLLGRGWHESKKEIAHNRAAHDALNNLRKFFRTERNVDDYVSNIDAFFDLENLKLT